MKQHLEAHTTLVWCTEAQIAREFFEGWITNHLHETATHLFP